MAKRVLVPVDGSPQSVAALELTAAEWPDAAITLLHVIDPVSAGVRRGVMPSGSEEWYQNAKAETADLFDRMRAEIGPTHAVETRMEVGRPSRTIVDVADGGRFDHVVMGSHGREGVSRILLGSTAENVVRKSPIPVTIVREASRPVDDRGAEGEVERPE